MTPAGSPGTARQATGSAGPGAGHLICVLGDAHLDVIVSLAAPVAPDTDTPAVTSVSTGGQAANVAAWVVALGGRARLVAARGTDLAGQLVSADLSARGVDLVGPVVDGRTGVVVALSDGGHARSMLTDRGVGPALSAAALHPEWFAGGGWLHLPAYSLVRQPVQGAALAAARYLPRLSVDLSSTAVLRDYGVAAFRELLSDLRPEVVFGTEPEMELAGQVPGAVMVVKLGERGVRVNGVLHPAASADAADATGAGDALAAGYLAGGISLGLAAAARAVSKMGAMP